MQLPNNTLNGDSPLFFFFLFFPFSLPGIRSRGKGGPPESKEKQAMVRQIEIPGHGVTRVLYRIRIHSPTRTLIFILELFFSLFLPLRAWIRRSPLHHWDRQLVHFLFFSFPRNLGIHLVGPASPSPLLSLPPSFFPLSPLSSITCIRYRFQDWDPLHRPICL